MIDSNCRLTSQARRILDYTTGTNKYKEMKSIAFVLVVFLLTVLISCKKEAVEQEELTSTSLSSDSHNTGLNCMDCHIKGGDGNGWFKMAGTVRNKSGIAPYITAKVELRTAQSGGGSTLYRVEVDQKGNFYTTNTIDFGTGLYASVVGGTATQYMTLTVTNGACNLCHDTSNWIWSE